jgi:ACS family tartrate transporter-like MFS transporter
MAAPDAAAAAAAVSRAARRLIPFLFVCYVVSYLDRVNLGFAASAFQRDLAMNDRVYGIGAGLFFLGYFVFEIPSNLILERVGARRWLARIMITWGLVSIAMMFAVGTWSFYALRVALGLAEAGFFPGAVLYLTYWFPQRERGRIGALFMAAGPVALIIGPYLSTALLRLDGLAGLRGWQWLFIGEGLPAVVLGIVAVRVLTDRPADAGWLSPEERAALAVQMAAEQGSRGGDRHVALLGSMKSGRVWLLCLVYFLNTTVSYGLFLWLPKILESASGWHDMRLAAISACPFVIALGTMVLVGRHSDRSGERKWHLAWCALGAAAGLVIAAVAGTNVSLLVLAFTICQAGQRTVQPLFWTLPPLVLGGTAAAAGFALINSIGNLGGFAGPTVMGYLRETTGGYAGGLLVLAAALVIQAAIVVALRLPAPAGPRSH